MKKPLEERFNKCVDKNKSNTFLDGDRCWEWIGTFNKGTGYGVISIDGVQTGAHRVSYQIHNGKIPAGKSVLHKCDNRMCVNPNHLYAGTTSQNAIDAYERNSFFVTRKHIVKANKIIRKISLLIKELMLQKNILPYSRQRKKQIEYKKDGRCVRCGNLRNKYKVHCDNCQEKVREESKKSYRRRKDEKHTP